MSRTEALLGAPFVTWIVILVVIFLLAFFTVSPATEDVPEDRP